MRILVVDDDSVHRTVLTRMVNRLGYTANTASDGFNAIAAVRSESYDVVLLDVRMPTLNGLQAAKAIQASFSAGDGPFVVALTADTNPATEAACFESGMDAYLAKPVRLETIKDLLTRIAASPGSDGAVSPADGPFIRRALNDAEPVEEPVVLDAEVLERFRSMMGADDAEFIRELEADFVQDAHALVHAVERAAGHADWQAVGRAAHALKSNSAMFGATRLSRLARRMERQADAGMPHAWQLLHGKLEAEIDAVQAELARYAPDAGTAA